MISRFFPTLKKLRALFGRKQKISFCILLSTLLFGAFLETLGVGAVPAFVSVFAFPETVMKHAALKPVLDYFNLRSSKNLLLYASISLIIIFILKNIYLCITYYLLATFAKNRQVDLGRRLFTAYMYAPYTFHLQRDTSELLRNINAETQRIVNGIITPLLTIIMQGLVLLCITALLLAVQPVITVAAAALLGTACIIFLKTLHKRISRRGMQAQEERKASIQAVRKGLGAIKAIHVAHCHEFFIRVFVRSRREMTSAEAFKQVAQKATQPFLESITITGMLTLTILLVLLGKDIQAIAPILALFGAAFMRLKSCLNQIVSSVTNFRYNAVSINPVYDDLSHYASKKPSQSSSSIASRHVDFKEKITLENVCYTYPGASAEALTDINLVIPKRSTVAFVGPTGSGKTTLVDVIMGLLTPNRGDIAVDAKSIFDNLALWQTCIGYVPQSIYLMNDTIKHNVALGIDDNEIDEKRFKRAAAIAQLEEFIDKLPQRENTNIGEHGVRLSGGQRQRIGIARALYHDPEVLIMDEATSALDNNTERNVIEAVSETAGKTIIMIAHRLSTVLNCDRLYFMKDGRIEDSGTYAELYQKNADFLQLAK